MTFEIIPALLAAIVGYLSGSISWARLIARRVAPTADISHIVEPVPRSSQTFQSDSVSATTVRIHVGTRYGCLTALLDMAKVALPVLAFRLWLPDQPAYLVAAVAGLVGHDWPLYHRFQGGRGESVIYGALLAIDPLGVVVTNAIGALLGLILGQLLVLRWAGLVLMIPWFWLRTGEWAPVLYILFANAVYWYTMSPELRQFFDLLDDGTDPTQEEIAEFMGMGVRLGRFLDRYSAPALVARLAPGRRGH